MGRPKGSKNKKEASVISQQTETVSTAETQVIITNGWCERCQRGHKFYDGKCLEM